MSATPEQTVANALHFMLGSTWAVGSGAKADVARYVVHRLASAGHLAPVTVSPLVSPRTTPADETAEDAAWLAHQEHRPVAPDSTCVCGWDGYGRVPHSRHVIERALAAALAASPADADTAEVEYGMLRKSDGWSSAMPGVSLEQAQALIRPGSILTLVQRRPGVAPGPWVDVTASSPVAATSEERDR